MALSSIIKDSALISGITKIMVILILCIFFITLEQKAKLNFCNILMPSEDTKTLEFIQYIQPDKAPFIISTDLECFIEKID